MKLEVRRDDPHHVYFACYVPVAPAEQLLPVDGDLATENNKHLDQCLSIVGSLWEAGPEARLVVEQHGGAPLALAVGDLLDHLAPVGAARKGRAFLISGESASVVQAAGEYVRHSVRRTATTPTGYRPPSQDAAAGALVAWALRAGDEVLRAAADGRQLYTVKSCGPRDLVYPFSVRNPRFPLHPLRFQAAQEEDRIRARETLLKQVGLGQLTLPEYEARVTAVTYATLRGEILRAQEGAAPFLSSKGVHGPDGMRRLPPLTHRPTPARAQNSTPETQAAQATRDVIHAQVYGPQNDAALRH